MPDIHIYEFDLTDLTPEERKQLEYRVENNSVVSFCYDTNNVFHPHAAVTEEQLKELNLPKNCSVTRLD